MSATLHPVQPGEPPPRRWLAWLVEGCRQWLAEGLGDPPEVTEAGIGWREEMDPLKEFLADCCEVEEGSYCKVSELRQAYRTWADENGEKRPLSHHEFGDRLVALECRQSKRYFSGVQHRSWNGIRLSGDSDKTQDATRRGFQ